VSMGSTGSSVSPHRVVMADVTVMVVKVVVVFVGHGNVTEIGN
jgi:hypothetical protein